MSSISGAVLGTAISYPTTATVDQVDDFHGVKISDPYRWLEQDVRESKPVRDWVSAQNEVTFRYLGAIGQRPRIVERMTRLWNYEKYRPPLQAGGRYFYRKNDGLQNQYVVYMQESLASEPVAVIDPNTWSKDGTVALSIFEPSPDGRHLAYGIQDGGSDWRSWRILDLQTGKLLPETLQWLKFTNVSWLHDSSGFYYSRYPAPEAQEKFQSLNLNQRVYFHKLGTAQSEDRLVFERPDKPEWGFSPQVSEDGAYLVVTVWKGTDERYQIYYRDLRRKNAPMVHLVDNFEHDYTFVGNRGSELLFRTNLQAPRGRLLGIDVGKPGNPRREVIAQTDNVLINVSFAGDRLLAEYLQDARSLVRIYDIQGKAVAELALPGIGSASGFNGKRDTTEVFFQYSSFNTPPAVYRYDVKTGQRHVWKRPKVPFDPDDYQVEQVFYPSADGTRVPMFIAAKKGLQRNGRQPTLLYGYGGFNISVKPQFSPARFAWMDMGGIYAVANLRGGGEYGEPWHKAGTRLQKQNVFDDFIAAAEYLIKTKYTNPNRLAIYGRSNGGLLVGAVTNQRPDLFAAAMPAVGVMDMLRFDQFTAGRFWVDDYGSAADPQAFKALRAYSPYHNIKPVDYPAVLVTTADTDDRVVPGHSFKYIARLQAQHTGADPVLVRIETRAGHGAGKPTGKIIEEYADRWAFLLKNLDMNLPKNYGR
ncbi:S9 family peptidase [Exilibacterium tricleocarpae]|uniref:prolyl oligopeptidase n=2 Tax=Exilibacterium tricleocarpae TaxID=2591008 RepID=A0A545UBH6_9GAMM|nr:S9 family peptidase [Exilibacterium tricleocarpae]